MIESTMIRIRVSVRRIRVSVRGGRCRSPAPSPFPPPFLLPLSLPLRCKHATVLLSNFATTNATITTDFLATQNTINTTRTADITTYFLATFSVADRHTAKQTTNSNQTGCNSSYISIVAWGPQCVLLLLMLLLQLLILLLMRPFLYITVVTRVLVLPGLCC